MVAVNEVAVLSAAPACFFILAAIEYPVKLKEVSPCVLARLNT